VSIIWRLKKRYVGLVTIASLFVFLTAACGPIFTSASTSPPAPTATPAAAAPAPVDQTAIKAKEAELANLNYLHTDGTKIVDSKGKEVRLTGVNWFGAETGVLAPHGLWDRNYKDMLDQIVEMGFNTIRLPYSNELLDVTQKPPEGIDYYKNTDLKDLNGIQILDKIITEAGKRNLKVILDQHRPDTLGQSDMWYSDDLTEAQWISDWKFLAQRYYGNDTVVGADLHNEPSGDATWGTDDPKTDWRLAAERAGNAVLSVNPDWLILVEGIAKSEDDFGNILDWYWQGGSLQFARVAPVRLDVPNRVVYSPHDYGPSVYEQGWFHDADFPKNLPDVWDHHWSYLVTQNIAPVLVGEFGGDTFGADTTEGVWQSTLLKFIKDNNMSYTYWAFNGNSADTGGLLDAKDWNKVNTDKVTELQTYQWPLMTNVDPTRVDTSTQPDPRPAGVTMKGLHEDITMLKWTKDLKPELYIANRTDQPLDLGNVEMRYYFGPAGADGQNAPEDQMVQVSPADTIGKPIDPGAITTKVVKYESKESVDTIYYVSITFKKGTIIGPRLDAGFALDITQKDGQAYDQEGHYSYRDYHWPAEWKKVTVYQNGKQIWGQEPDQYLSIEKQKRLDKEAAVAAKHKTS
jgi:endoglucanase